jgi:ubiquinone/menaquinone biosynthesis C-methylase UbiE
LSHPLEYHNFVLSEIGKKRKMTVLDVGAGFGIWGYLIHTLRKPSLLVGLDIDKNYLSVLKKHKIYDCVVLASASALPVTEKIFDYVLAVEVIEHLPKLDGESMISELERVCLQKVILTTPNGYLSQHSNTIPQSEIHRSSWSAREFRKKGYKVRGMGLKGSSRWRSEKGLALYGALNHFSTLISFFLCEISEYILAVKKLNAREC